MAAYILDFKEDVKGTDKEGKEEDFKEDKHDEDLKEDKRGEDIKENVKNEENKKEEKEDKVVDVVKEEKKVMDDTEDKTDTGDKAANTNGNHKDHEDLEPRVVHPKTDEQRCRLQEACRDVLLFTTLDQVSKGQILH